MFKIEKKIKGALGRAGVLKTEHGDIKTPAFASVGTKATVKALTPIQIKEAGSPVVLANTYHLYLNPGEKLVRKNGGLHKFMSWDGPIITDSGGFQVFSLGVAYGNKISKILKSSIRENIVLSQDNLDKKDSLVIIDENGVKFRNPINGDTHQFTPEKSIQIQQDLGADIIFAFDECTSPLATYEYQKEAMDRTHSWAKRCVIYHENRGDGRLKRFTKNLLKIENEKENQLLFGIVQGGRFEDLRKESAKIISKLNFDGFGIGGSFDKEDINTALKWINLILPEEKPRHLLGIGEPLDILKAIENGADMFDCVMPTRMARNGTLLTKKGRIAITNSRFISDINKVEDDCGCYTCKNFTKSYISHLFRSKEILAYTLASIHNLYFINQLMKNAREHILLGTFVKFRESFEREYKS